MSVRHSILFYITNEKHIRKLAGPITSCRISFKYKFKEELNAEHIKLLHRKGLKIQLWTVDSVNNIEEAISINPDFIQTDNLKYFTKNSK